MPAQASIHHAWSNAPGLVGVAQYRTDSNYATSQLFSQTLRSMNVWSDSNAEWRSRIISAAGWTTPLPLPAADHVPVPFYLLAMNHAMQVTVNVSAVKRLSIHMTPKEESDTFESWNRLVGLFQSTHWRIECTKDVVLFTQLTKVCAGRGRSGARSG